MPSMARLSLYREFQAPRDELEKARGRLAERKIVDKAKGILMQKRGMSEERADQFLRKTAMSRNTRLAEVARMLISLAEGLE